MKGIVAVSPPLPSLNARDVKSRADFFTIASRYMHLRRAGRQFVGLCPFHRERHPSCYVEPGQKIWKCFGCGAGGDLFNFVMRASRCDFPRALRIVADLSGVVHAGDETHSCERRTVRLESFAEAAARIVASLPAPGFVPSCPRCFAPMDFRHYRGNRFGGVYHCDVCSVFFGPKDLRAKLLTERGSLCEWCREADRPLQMHHILKKGNQYDPASIVLFCSGCYANIRKALAIHGAFERRSRECPERSGGHSPIHSPESRTACEPERRVSPFIYHKPDKSQ
jgi:hypothetical protein